MKKIRSPIVDGIFYPDDGEALTERTQKLLSDAPQTEMRIQKPIRGIIVPHAAYDFAGQVAARAFKACTDRVVKTVVLLGSVHREPAEQIYVTESEAFSTPAGDLLVDTEKAEDLVSCSTTIIAKDIPHLEEHCLEVQLPFIQILFPGVSILPVLLGGKTKRTVEACARAFRTVFLDDLESTLFVVTSNTAAAETADAARQQAEIFKQYLKTTDLPALTDPQVQKSISACGAACASVLFHEQLGCTEVQYLGEAVSKDTDPEIKPIVHYASYIVS
jgi:hypothetical protein